MRGLGLGLGRGHHRRGGGGGGAGYELLGYYSAGGTGGFTVDLTALTLGPDGTGRAPGVGDLIVVHTHASNSSSGNYVLLTSGDTWLNYDGGIFVNDTEEIGGRHYSGIIDAPVSELTFSGVGRGGSLHVWAFGGAAKPNDVRPDDWNRWGFQNAAVPVTRTFVNNEDNAFICVSHSNTGSGTAVSDAMSLTDFNHGVANIHRWGGGYKKEVPAGDVSVLLNSAGNNGDAAATILTKIPRAA